jgi:NAD(P)H-dependent FMN reductase
LLPTRRQRGGMDKERPLPKLGVIVASVREGRMGEPVSQWVLDRVRAHGQFEIRLLDLKQINLPMLSERHHPRFQKYEQESTRAWSRMVSDADAFVIVTPEYNYSSPPAIVNALDHLYVEWNYKPAGFVSYGGLSGGSRSVQMTKNILTTLKVVPLADAVHITYISRHVTGGVFQPEEAHEKSVKSMLDELLRWTNALAPLRAVPPRAG